MNQTSNEQTAEVDIVSRLDTLSGTNRRTRFLRACQSLPVDHPPVWIMRQAGRALPEYRALKEKYSFLQLAQTPDLAAEVTLQPIRRFSFDAAIIFSDILVVPEAMGVPYHFRETGGVELEFPIRSHDDVKNLSTSNIVDRLHYVAEAIRLVKRDLDGQTALLGFAGSPWTLANFMIDGGSSKEHTRALALFNEDRPLYEQLCDKLTSAVTTFLRMQIAAGVDAVQIFDSLGGLIPTGHFQAASGVWIREIIAALGGKVPVTVFSKGTRDWRTLEKTGTNVIGVDHGISLTGARESLSDRVALQGNLDPVCLVTDTPDEIRNRVNALLSEMHDRNGYIFNLGHGLPPNARLENIQAIIETIRSSNRRSKQRHTRPEFSESVSF
jgi:uroporphyrinogen decarboxylase